MTDLEPNAARSAWHRACHERAQDRQNYVAAQVEAHAEACSTPAQRFGRAGQLARVRAQERYDAEHPPLSYDQWRAAA